MVLHHIFDIFLPIVNGDEASQEDMFKFLDTIKIHNIIRLSFMIMRGFSLVVLKKKNKLFLHLFRKRFNKNYGYDEEGLWTTEAEYLSTIILNSKLKTPKKYDWIKIDPENELEFKDNEVKVKEFTEKEKDEFKKPNYKRLGLTKENLLITLNNLVEYNFRVNASNNEILNPGEYGDLFDLDFYQDLYKSNTGVEFGYEDIRWQILIRECLINTMGRTEPYILNYLKYTDFKKSTLKTSYFPNYKNNSIFEININDSTTIECDVCRVNVSEFYHNFVYGDLCQKCYEKKKETDLNKINGFKKLMLLQGKKIVFQNQVQKTREFLDKIGKIPKPKKSTRDKILRRAFNDLIKIKKSSDAHCGICLGDLVLSKERSISSGTCGHCFHTHCLSNLTSNECPLCRETTLFFNLFL